MKSTLNKELLASMIREKRGSSGLRDTAKAIGNISSATLSRIEAGNLPDVETFIHLCKWLNVSTETFAVDSTIKKEPISEKEKLVYQLRSSQELDSKTVEAMVTMVNLAFTKLK